MSRADIAHRLHHSRSTISRKVKRGTVQQRNSDYLFIHCYYAYTSQLFHERWRLNFHSKGLLIRCST